MSNLGLYQVVTTLMKRVGGPKKFFAMILGAGAAGGAVATLAIQKVISIVEKRNRSNASLGDIEFPYQFKKKGKEGREKVKPGEKFRVLNNDGDVVFIQKESDPEYFHFLSEEFLMKVSDFPGVNSDPNCSN